jgi:hypothetical protein
MADAGVTLADLVQVDKQDLRKAIADHLGSAAGARAAALAPVLDVVSDRVAGCLDAAFRADLVEVAAKAFADLRELHNYAGPDQPPGGAEATLNFAENALKAPQTLKLHLAVDGFDIPALELTLDLELVFETLAVTVKAGHVRALGLGPTRAEAALRYKESTLAGPFEKSLARLEPKSFDPGFAIP